MPRYNKWVGKCIHCGEDAYYNEEEDKLQWGRWDLCDCLHELEPEPAFINASDENLDEDSCCRLCGMVWYNCLCSHDN